MRREAAGVCLEPVIVGETAGYASAARSASEPHDARRAALGTGLTALRTLVLDDRTVIGNGQEDVWYDQGVAIGSSPDVLRLYDVKKRWFAMSALDLREWPSHWPSAWLA